MVWLSRLTRWPLSDILPLHYAEACAWLEEAVHVEKEIRGK